MSDSKADLVFGMGVCMFLLMWIAFIFGRYTEGKHWERKCVEMGVGSWRVDETGETEFYFVQALEKNDE